MTNYKKSMSEAYKQVLLGEDNMDLLKKAAGGAMQTLKMKDGKLKMDSFTASAIMAVYKAINPKNKKTMENLVNTGTKSAIMKLQSLAMKQIKSGYHEEAELDEKKIVLAKGMGREVINDNGVIKVMKGSKVISDGDYDSGAGKFFMNIKGERGQVAFNEPEELLKIKEEIELEEGRMKELHMLIKQGKSAEEIAKIMKVDAKTIKALMSAYIADDDKYPEMLAAACKGGGGGPSGGTEYMSYTPSGDMTEGARADAMRAMRRSKEVDPADVDITATDDDVKAASKNIMMQMRKVISLRGNFKVEFGDKKKMKIDPRIAQAVMSKYDSMRKPAEKEKFQAKVAKSYKDMLSALKESLDEDLKVAHKVKAKDGGYFVILHRDTKGMRGKQDKFIMRHIKGGKVTDYGSHVSVDSALKFAKNKNIIEEIELNEVFDFVLLDKDNKIAGRYSGKDAKKAAESGKRSAHLPPMNIPKGDVKKMKIVPISPKDKKGIGDTVLAIGEDMTVTGSTDGSISQRDLDYVQKELRRLGIKDAVVDQNEMDKDKIDVKTKMSDDKVKKAFDKSKMTVTYEHVQMEGTWHTPKTPKELAGLKKLLKKPVIFGKDGDDAIDAISDYIGDDELYDDLYDNGKKNSKGDARPVIKAAMKRLGIKEEKETILDRIDIKIKERKNG